MKITVLGAGAWGTALAMAAAQRHDTLLWARDGAQAQALASERRNRRYLGEVSLPPTLRVTADHRSALAHARAGLTVLATPMAGLREQLAALDDGRPALWLCKGFEAGTGALGHEVAREVRPKAAAGVLSGPSFALEVARGQPTALVAASTDAALTQAAVAAFHGESLRVYTSSDVVGVEVGGAVKNVLAIATGIVDGLAAQGETAPGRWAQVRGAAGHAGAIGAPGLNARAALITRGLAEMTRLGVALGARPDTFMGLSGLGDLVLTATGDLSRNRRVGLMLAAGHSLADTLRELGHVSEGVYSAATVRQRALSVGVDMPITVAVCEVLAGRLSPEQALRQLMARDPRAEG